MNQYKILKTAAEAVVLNSDVTGIIDDLEETAEHLRPYCIGLAANQIWDDTEKPPPRIFVVDTAEGWKAFINPRVLKLWGSAQKLWEGCMSKPGKQFKVKRWRRTTLQYYDEGWNLREEEFMYLPSQIIQHEIDHLDGKLI